MNFKSILSVLVSVLILSVNIHSQTPLDALSGNYTIGPGGNFKTVQIAMDSLHKAGIKDAVILELQPDYSSSVEVFPLIFEAIPFSSTAKTITLRPASHATGMKITSDNSIATIHLKNISHFILDGRPGGAGSERGLLITNTSTSANTIRFTNDASYNQLQYLSVIGSSEGSYNGIIFFGGTDSSKGNDFNQLHHCHISSGSYRNQYGIFSNGTYQKPNTGLVINKCEIVDIFSIYYDSYPVYGGLNTDSMVITNNSIYQTKTYTLADSRGNPVKVGGIFIEDPFSGVHLIANNHIGGRAPECGGGAFELKGQFYFKGIQVTGTISSTASTKITGNVINNLSFAGQGYCEFIVVGDQNKKRWFNGEIKNNRVGREGPVHGIRYESQKELGQVFGIKGTALCSDSLYIENNQISGTLVSENPINLGGTNYCGIQIDNYPTDRMKAWIRYNTIGSLQAPRSILNTAYSVTGIFVAAGRAYPDKLRDTVIVNNNTIANMAGTNSVSSAAGIALSGGSGQTEVNGNEIFNLFGEYQTFGISSFDVNLFGSHEYSGNKIYSLYCGDRLDYITSLAGIRLMGKGISTVPYRISRNYIHHLMPDVSTPYSKAYIHGILLQQEPGFVMVDNNIIHLGCDTAGKSFAPAASFFGITDGPGVIDYFHNTVMITGNISIPRPGSSSGFSSYIYANPNHKRIMNNIFVNNRQNIDIEFGNSNAAFTLSNGGNSSIICDYNLFFNKGEGNCPVYGGTTGPHQDLSTWRTQTGWDLHSKIADPLFINENGKLSELNLHIKDGSPVNMSGTTEFTTQYDFDGDHRASLSPVDIGADAGLFGSEGNPTGVVDINNEDFKISVFPNPVKNIAQLRIISRKPAKLQCAVYTPAGNMITSQIITVRTGINYVSLPADQWKTGVYFLQIRSGNNAGTIRLLK